MKTFILASLLALTAVSGVVVASQPAAAAQVIIIKPIPTVMIIRPLPTGGCRDLCKWPTPPAHPLPRASNQGDRLVNTGHGWTHR